MHSRETLVALNRRAAAARDTETTAVRELREALRLQADARTAARQETDHVTL